MNFNTDPGLWRNLLSAVREPLVVTDGHVIEHKDVIGRFTSTDDAVQCLKSVGYIQDTHFIVKENVDV